MTRIVGERVILRPFRQEEFDVALAREPSEDADRREVRRRRLALSGTRTAWELMFAVESEGRLIGDIQARCSDQAMPPGVWEVGIDLWGGADRGRGLGSEAVGLLVRHLFANEGAHRVQATTDVNNMAMRRSLETCGFSFEGVLRGFMPTAEGGARDYALYAMTMTDHREEPG
ncbi:MAG TPA: GNAT family protein [Actinomycetota bacterium]|nr:GNAT family protein [Actinomycetota bacterium]